MMKTENNSLGNGNNAPDSQCKKNITIDYESLLKKFIHPTINSHNPAKLSSFEHFILQKPSFLVIDDNNELRQEIIAKTESFNIGCAGSTLQNALENYYFSEYDQVILILDLRPVSFEGHTQMLQQIEKKFSSVPVILIDNQARTQGETEILSRMSIFRLKSLDDNDQLMNALQVALYVKNILFENNMIKQSISFPHNIIHPSGNSEHIQELNKTINELSLLETPVMIPGEEGTQKHYLAQQIHLNSVRTHYPFDIVSLYLLPPECVGVYLFGCVPGYDPRYPYGVIGKLELIHRGTIFIDYIEYLEPKEQQQLLLFLKTRAFCKKGSTQTVFSNVRIIAAYYNNLHHDVELGIFNQELYDLLYTSELYSPPLRELKNVLPEYVRLGISWAAVTNNLPVPQVDKSAIDKMVNYSWPHNRKEFEVIIHRAVFIDTDGVVTAEDIQFDLNPPDDTTKRTTPKNMGLGGLTMQEIQKQAIMETLKLNQGNKIASARMLGISEKTLYNKLKLFNMND
ncbi:MAG: sigma 54-interacting transcriptional regulator [Planctomycetaceae bacterium]|jgi:DNA-binding NtrC family response regulator|nr:sigma 54-interacting transcriptional regulator [Planctomycetaceae bacterium]